MEKRLIEIFQDESVKLTYKAIKKQLGISRQHKDEELKKILKKLELDGIIYFDELNNIYQRFPSNFFVTEILFSSKNNPYIILNNEQIMLNSKNLNGAINYDIVVIEKTLNSKACSVKKILKRTNPQIVCEVKKDDNEMM